MGAYSYSGTAASNTSIDGIGAAGSNSPANLDDLHRAQAAGLANFVRDLGGANTVGGTADAITITLADATTLPAYFDGLVVGFIAGADNLTQTTTVNIDSVGAKTIKKTSAGVETDLGIGDIQEGAYYLLRYRSAWAAAAGAFELVSFASAAASQALGTTDAPTFADLTITDDLTVGDDILLANGAVINWDSGNATLTHSTGALAFGNCAVSVTRGSASLSGLRLYNTADNASVNVLRLDGDRATPTDGDAAYVDYNLSDSAGNQDTFVRMTYTGVDITSTTEDGKLAWSVMKAGTLTELVSLDPTNGFVFSNATPGLKAFVRFDGTGTPAIAGGFNVASITDNGVGDYTLNFTTALADTNYTVVGTAKRDNNTTARRTYHVQPCAYATGSVRILTGEPNSTSDTDIDLIDCALINVVVYGT